MIDSPISDRDARGAMDYERWERRLRIFMICWTVVAVVTAIGLIYLAAQL